MESEILHKCSSCGIEKPIERFWKGRICRTDRGKSLCKTCARKSLGLDWELLERKDDAALDGKRICRKCGIALPIDFFRLDARTIGGKQYRSSYCKNCVPKPSGNRNIRTRGKRIHTPEKIKRLRAVSDIARNNPQHKKEILFDSGERKTCSRCRQEKPVSCFAIMQSNGDGFQSYCKSCINEMNKSRRKTDLKFKVSQILRCRFNSALGRHLRGMNVSSVRDLGCSFKEFISHIESKFSIGMSWENMGNSKGCWNIDHIVPLLQGGFVDLSDSASVKKVCHYTNLRPLWVEENLRRNAKEVLESELRSLGLLADDGTVTFPCDKLASAM